MISPPPNSSTFFMLSSRKKKYIDRSLKFLIWEDKMYKYVTMRNIYDFCDFFNYYFYC